MADTTTTNILVACRSALRITSSDYDDEISTLIAAAKIDIKRGGVIATKAQDDTDPLVRTAIICYVKASFGLDNDEADHYATAYQSMLAAMKLSSEYGQTLTETDDG